MIQNSLQYCESKENFRVDLLAQEINQIIFCGLLCFGCKKESKMHQYFKDNLKEFIVDEWINNTKYASSLKEISFENINPAFVTNLKLLVTNIIDNDKEEEKIMDLIKELKKSENSNQISFVSTSISEENKCIFDENKNTQKPVASTLDQIDIQNQLLNVKKHSSENENAILISEKEGKNDLNSISNISPINEELKPADKIEVNQNAVDTISSDDISKEKDFKLLTEQKNKSFSFDKEKVESNNAEEKDEINKKETDLNNSMEITKGELLKNGVMNKTEEVGANNEEKKEEINFE